MTATTAATTPVPAALGALVGDLDAAVAAGGSAHSVADRVAAALAPFLGRPGLLTPDQQAGDPARYRTHLLHVPDDGAYSLVAAVWRPGQRTAVHDHVCWCVVGVHLGEEHETR